MSTSAREDVIARAVTDADFRARLLADPEGTLAAEGYDVAHDPRGGGRTEWTDTGQIAHYIETTDDGDALIYVVDEFGPRAKIKTVYTGPGLIAVARAASKDSPRSRSARASEARENAPPPEPKRRPWATQAKNQPPRSLEAQAADAREYIAIYEQQAAAARARHGDHRGARSLRRRTRWSPR